MKKITMLLSAMVLSVAWVFAQQSNFVVNEIEENMSQGKQTGFEILIPEVDVKSVQSSLSKWTKSNKGKFVSSKREVELFQDNVMLHSVSENTIDMYTILSSSKEGVVLKTFVDLGGAFISSAEHPQAFDAMEKELITFAKDQLITKVGGDIKAEEKHFKKLQSELKKLESNNKKFHKDIAKNKDNIQKQELAIKKNEMDQVAKEEQIALQEEILLAVREKSITMGNVDDATAKMMKKQVKGEEKSLKQFRSHLKKLKSQLKSSVNSIAKSKSTIAQREQDIIQNEKEQETKYQQIELQQKIIDAVKQKKSDIR